MMTKRSASLLLAVAGIAALTSCSTSTAANGDGGDGGSITLEVGGTATQASITYTDGGTQTSQENNVAVPWTKEIPAKDGAITYQVIAQNAGGGDITCKITDATGEVLAENTSTGDYAIATCNS